jgi:hypothetical protein
VNVNPLSQFFDCFRLASQFSDSFHHRLLSRASRTLALHRGNETSAFHKKHSH